MPIFMDIHIVPGVTSKTVAAAHQLDILAQDHHQCRCMTYWIDEERENVFCLIEAPTKEAVENMHAKAHGMLPNRIIEVNGSVVESFLGRIYDPRDAEVNEDGLKIFHDPSFRILLATRITDPFLLKCRLGDAEADNVLDAHKTIVRKALKQFGGSEAELDSTAFITSFRSAADAVSAARSIQREMRSLPKAGSIDFTIGISAGEPVEKSEKLFGESLQMANYLCTVAANFHIAVSASVKELAWKDHFQKQDNMLLALTAEDENTMRLLFTKLEENWQDAEFDITKYCQATIMSKSQLYRRVIGLTGLSPNQLLKDFRLDKAKTMLRKKHSNIAQVTFESGFTSPSYFTKCFKKKYGLLPMGYLELLS